VRVGCGDVPIYFLSLCAGRAWGRQQRVCFRFFFFSRGEGVPVRKAHRGPKVRPDGPMDPGVRALEAPLYYYY
jgi:hypothetical protein